MDEHSIAERIGKQIKFYRKQAKISQSRLADELFISETSVSNWERGKYIPTQDNLIDIARILNIPISKLYSTEKYAVNERMFDESHMERFIFDKLSKEHFPMSLKALEYIKKTRKNDRRIGMDNVPYIYHPFLMVCQVFAMNIDSDAIVATCLLHDALESGSSQKNLVEIGMDSKVIGACVKMVRSNKNPKLYFEGLSENPLACLVKCLSRCSNLSTMNSITDSAHRKRCIEETEKYYGGLLKILKGIPEWNNAAWLLSYQIQALCEAHKLLG